MFETAFTIEWGDCDEAGIVFYPNYFYWFDCTYQRWLRQYGLSQRELRRRFQSVTPLVDVGAQFVGPARYDDELRIRAEVTEWRERRFRIDYKLSVGGVPVASGFEQRAWAALTDTGELRGARVRVQGTNGMKRKSPKEAGEDDNGTAPGGIQALDAALAVLRVFRSFDGPATLSDIAREAGMPPSKVHRYLASFIHAGLAVQRERSGRYDLGPEAAELGVSAISRNNFVVRAAEGLEELAETTGQAALLAVWSNSGPTVVRMERGPNLTTTSIGLGSTFPLLDSATGRVFLSYLPRQQLMLRLQLEIDRAAEAGINWPDLSPDLGSVQELTKRIRRERIAHVDGRFIPGLNAISSAITNWQEEIEVAVTLFGTHRELMEPGSSTRTALVEFASRHSIVPPAQLSNRGIRAP